MLPVPYISQLEEGAKVHNNDCGAACGVMLVKAFQPDYDITVDQFYDMCNPGADVYLSAGQVVAALARCQVVSAWKYGIKLWDCFEYLRGGHPMIALINYGVLVANDFTAIESFKGAHFVVIVGMDIQHIYIHDPYYPGDGDNVAIPIDIFLEAWGSCHLQSNPNNCAIVVSDSLFKPAIMPAAVGSVRVTANSLTIRNGAGTNFKAVGYLKKGDKRQIYARQSGWGDIGGGRWISMKYTEEI